MIHQFRGESNTEFMFHCPRNEATTIDSTLLQSIAPRIGNVCEALSSVKLVCAQNTREVCVLTSEYGDSEAVVPSPIGKVTLWKGLSWTLLDPKYGVRPMVHRFRKRV